MDGFFDKGKKSYHTGTECNLDEKAPTSMKQGNVNARKWFTALMLSPGVLFAAAYLTVWLSTNFYLDHRFREHLTRAFNSASGSRYRLSIGDLDTSLELSSLTLQQLELVPVSGNSPEHAHRIRIDKLDISCPEIGLVLFSPSKVDDTTERIARQLICRCRNGTLSMNQEPRPAPAYR